MSNTATVTHTYVDEDGVTLTGVSLQVTADIAVDLSHSLALNDTDVEVDVSIPVADIQAFILTIEQTDSTVANRTLGSMGVTVKTNSSVSPDQTFTLLPNQGIVWVAGTPVACPITTDITKLFLTDTVGQVLTDVVLKVLTTKT